MNSNFRREYFVLRTMGNDPIGLVSLIRPISDSCVYEFSLHRPQDKNTDNEFMDLTFTGMDYPEFETHRDVFETHPELEVVNTYYSSSNMTNTLHVLVRAVEKDG